MTEYVFSSPGYKFRERDLTYVQKNVGITTLGLVGETVKGPAFEPIYIEDKSQFSDKFGPQDTSKYSYGGLRYQLPYVANAYLSESNQLWVTRVLGLSGYDAGTAWPITMNSGLDPSTITEGAPFFVSGETFTDNTFHGVTISYNGQTGTAFQGFLLTGTTFTGTIYDFTVTAYNNASGTTSYTGTTLTGTSYTTYANMVVAVLRSKATVVDVANATPSTTWSVTGVTITNNNTNIVGGDLLGEFTITAALNPALGLSTSTVSYVVSLNPNSSNFITNVLGATPDDKQSYVWVEMVLPDLLQKLDGEGVSISTYYSGLSGYSAYGFGVSSTVVAHAVDADLPGRKTKFKTPETPWIVSQLKGNNVDRLFKFISISDGDYANREIKVSIQNINLESLEFDVVIRSYYDTDANPVVLESFTRCSLIKSNTGFIGKRIGTSDGEYSLMSKYIMVELSDTLTDESFPAGFEGYMLNDYKGSIKTPVVLYKTEYLYNDKVSKTYLGLSNTAYSTANIVGTGINENLFNYNGWNNSESNSTGYTMSYGFHMDAGASATGTTIDNESSFMFSTPVGSTYSFKSILDVLNTSNAYNSAKTRKFTLAFSGGFDGWDINRTNRTNTDNYRMGGLYDAVANGVTPSTDFIAWQTAINTYSNPESVTINVFATPGINWSDNTVLINDTITMIEEQRTDSLYIIDSPNVGISSSIDNSGGADITAASDIVDLLNSTDIDSNYSCTYFPFIQIADSQNNVNVYLPPTGEVVKAIAYTDTKAFPWFAPAGLDRGTTDAKKSKYKLSQDARDILYKGRINPMVDFSGTGTVIFGQKTLQKKESALDRINVRRLLLQIKVLFANIAVNLLFEPNDQTVIDQFKQKANPILDTIKRERGLYGFKIVMDDTLNTPETIDRNELYGEIYLQPTRSVEFIGIGFTIMPTGASFANI